MNKSKNTIVHVRPRVAVGKSNVSLRKSGYIPANIYGLHEDSLAIELEVAPVKKIIADQGENVLMYLDGATDKQVPSLMSEIQHNNLTGEPIHISFKRVNLNEKVRVEVEIELVGETDIADATVILTRNVLEIEALPGDLPEKFEIDISGLTEVGQALHLSDIKYDKSKVEVILSEEEMEAPIVLVQEVKEVVEEEPVAEETPADGAAPATPAEGEATPEESKE